jgi:hypothetical protein
MYIVVLWKLVTRHAGGKLKLADVVHNPGTDDARGRPRRQQTAVDGACELRAEHVDEIG